MGGDRGIPHAEITVIDAGRVVVVDRIRLNWIGARVSRGHFRATAGSESWRICTPKTWSRWRTWSMAEHLPIRSRCSAST